MAGEADDTKILPPLEQSEPISHRDDINNDVAAALASLKGEAEPPAGADEPAAEAPPTDRARAPDGKFIPKEQAPVAAAVPDPKSPPPGDQAKASTEQPSTAANAPPVSWAADAKATWASLPPAIQNAVIKRETEFSSGIVQKSEQVRRYEQALAPVAQESQKRGMTVDQGIQRLMDGQRFLETQPAQAILWLAQQNGIDLAELASNPPAAQQQVRTDPMLSQVTQTVQSLQSRLDAMTTGQNMTLVEAFASSSDNPHYADVEDSLPGLIKEVQAINPNLSPADTLKQAYDRAVWLNPAIREKVIAEQTGAQQQARVTQLQAKATQAAKAAVSVKGSSAPSAAPRKPESNGTVHDDVRAAINQLKSA